MTSLLHGSGFQRLVLIKLTLRLTQSEWGKNLYFSCFLGRWPKTIPQNISIATKRFKTSYNAKVRQ